MQGAVLVRSIVFQERGYTIDLDQRVLRDLVASPTADL